MRILHISRTNYKDLTRQDNEGDDMSGMGSGTREVADYLRKNYFIKSISNWQMTATIETDKMQMKLHTRICISFVASTPVASTRNYLRNMISTSVCHVKVIPGIMRRASRLSRP